MPEESRLDDRDDQALRPQKADLLRISQFVISSLVALTLLGVFLASIMVTLIQDSFSPLGYQVGSDLSTYLFAAGLGGIGLLMIPSAVCAGKRLFGKGVPHQFQWGKFVRIGSLAPLLILLGYGIQTAPDGARGFLPLVHVLANTAAVFWLLGFVCRRIPAQSASRFWGTFAAGLGLTPLVTFILEIFILIGIGLIWALVLAAMPGFRQDLLNLAALVQNSSTSPQDLQRALGEFAARPGVLFTLFGYVAVLIPVVEEFFKPAAVWLLWRRKLEPWEGFILGATSGAGYALFENLTIGAAAEAWTFVTLTRLGTAAVHMFTAGLMGWGLALASEDKKYGRIARVFLGAVTLHGLWNGLNILSAVGGFDAVRKGLGPFWIAMADFAPVALIILALGCFGGLIKANKHFRRAIIAGSDR